jgi:tetratricopeptide (TPR) repeat protein
VASTEEEATGDSEVLPAVHDLGDWLRKYLGEELAQINLNDEQLERVTTPSLRALELYSTGMQFMLLGRSAEAEALFRQAVVEDPEFASANLFVFWALENQGRGFEKEALSFLKRAMELVDSTSEQERYFIEATYYDLLERDYQKACGSYKTLAELFPDHFFAAGNAANVCGGKLGHREDHVRFLIQAAEHRPFWASYAAAALTLLEGDFDRARPFVGRLRGIIADGGMPESESGGWQVAFTELFSAEEYLDKGLLPEAVSELQRVELALGSMDPSWQSWVAWRLSHFYLALGQIKKAEALDQGSWYTGMFQAWTAFLVSDRSAFWEQIEKLRTNLRDELPDPTGRLIELLSWNTGWTMDWFPLDVLVPLYDPESAVATALTAGEPSPEFLSLPVLKAKLHLARGRQKLIEGHPDEGIVLLSDGVAWFRDNGLQASFSYYFLGVEFLAVALVEQGDLQAAYLVLEDAAGQRKLVNSFTVPQHQKIQARRALLARELGRTAEAESIEAELAEALRFADEDHPILIQIREQQRVFLEIE